MTCGKSVCGTSVEVKSSIEVRGVGVVGIGGVVVGDSGQLVAVVSWWLGDKLCTFSAATSRDCPQGRTL